MRIAFFGDVVGRDARDALNRMLPGFKKEYGVDIAIVNAENAAHGYGINAQICTDMYNAGVDCISTGNHVWDQREAIPYIEKDARLLRPINFPPGTPGRGVTVIETAGGKKIAVVNVMTRLFMDPLDDPFAAVEKMCAQYRLGLDAQAIFVDVHGEATSEKQALGHYLDGRVSCVVGTHTHVPTADTRILAGGTGFQTDAGMCGNFDSVIGMNKQASVLRFVRKMPGEKLSPVEGAPTLCGVVADIDDKTGLCKGIWPVRIGPLLIEALPPKEKKA